MTEKNSDKLLREYDEQPEKEIRRTPIRDTRIQRETEKKKPKQIKALTYFLILIWFILFPLSLLEGTMEAKLIVLAISLSIPIAQKFGKN